VLGLGVSVLKLVVHASSYLREYHLYLLLLFLVHANSGTKRKSDQIFRNFAAHLAEEKEALCVRML
jgi:trans-2-enoyl-CoA reductase